MYASILLMDSHSTGSTGRQGESGKRVQYHRVATQYRQCDALRESSSRTEHACHLEGMLATNIKVANPINSTCQPAGRLRSGARHDRRLTQFDATENATDNFAQWLPAFVFGLSIHAAPH